MVMKPYWCDFERDEPELYRQVMEYIPRIEGKPFIRICGFNGSCFVGERIHELRVFEAQLEGKTDWSVSIEDFPDEIWDGFWIAYDCIVLKPDWIIDTYFKFFYVFTPELISQAINGDLDFVDSFLRSNNI